MTAPITTPAHGGIVALGEDDQRCPDCGFLNCICFDDDERDEEDDFDCHMGPDGQCGAAGSEWCDWECPTMRAYCDGSLP